METKGIIESNKSDWCSPVVIVKKKDNSFRFTLDLTRINDIVQLDELGIPRIEELVSNLHGNKFFSILDLKDGFVQVNLIEEHRKKTAFLDSNNRLMQFVKMPQDSKIVRKFFSVECSLFLKILLEKRAIHI